MKISDIVSRLTEEVQSGKIDESVRKAKRDSIRIALDCIRAKLTEQLSVSRSKALTQRRKLGKNSIQWEDYREASNAHRSDLLRQLRRLADLEVEIFDLHSDGSEQ